MNAGRKVSFFLRLHRHLPDKYCDGIAISGCKYRPDSKAINELNEHIVELQKDPEFLKKEKEFDEAVKAKWIELKELLTTPNPGNKKMKNLIKNY